MTFDFNKLVTIGFDKWKTAPFRFYGEKEPFFIGNKIEQNWRDVILSGNTALTLVNAKANSLEYLKLFGGTELLPETYLDTVTLSGGCEQRNLPSGHQELSYLQGDATAYIQTPVTPTTNTGMKIVFEYGSAGGSGAICGVFDGVAPRKDTLFVSTNSGTVDTSWAFIAQAGSTLTSTNSEAPVAGKTYTALINYKNSGTYGFEGFTQQSVGTNGVRSNKVLLFARLNIANNNITASNCKIKYVEFTEGTATTHIYIPDRFNNTLGLYDKITGAFLTNTNTSGSFTAGADVTTPQPQQPLSIWCNNGVIKVSKNVFDYKYYYDHYQIYQTSSVGRCPIKLKPNTTYTISTNTEFNTISAQIFVVSGSAINWTPNTSNNGVLINSPRTVTTDSNGYLCVGIYYKGDSTIPESDFENGSVWVQIEEGSSATAYTPYSADGIYTDGTQEVVTDSLGNTASAERLLAVGTYKDTQSVINGSVTKRVGIYVLDGTENWSKSSTYTGSFYTNILNLTDGAKVANNPNVYCTHGFKVNNLSEYSSAAIGATYWYSQTTLNYKYDNGTATVAQFQQWLADQYANGTPVTIAYPLATATTSTVSGQFLSKSPVTQTAGSISGLPIAITESAHTTPTPQQPLPINCNNGVVKVKNLFNNPSYISGNLNDDGIYTSSASLSLNYYAVKPDTTYTLSFVKTRSSYYDRICGYQTTTEESFTGLLAKVDYRNIPLNTRVAITFTTTSTTNYIRGFFPSSAYFTDQPYLTEGQLELGSTATSYMPYGQIYTDGTTETVEIFGNNLFTTTGATTKAYLTSSGAVQSMSSSMRSVTDYIKVRPSTKYMLKGIGFNDGAGYIRLGFQYTTSKSAITQIGYPLEHNTFTTDATCEYIRIQYMTNSESSVVFAEEISGTATAQPLYKVGNYQDVQEVIAGSVIKNVGIKVLDGSEDWKVMTNARGYYLKLNDLLLANYETVIGFCTHFKFNFWDDNVTPLPTNNFGFNHNGTTGLTNTNVTIKPDLTVYDTVDKFKAYLATQYNAGQPVVVLYPLATPTTQTVTAQPMNIQAGTNVVQITQASMDDLELEVKYKAGVAVTIEEIENAQLDDNVEVTING